MSYLGVPPFGQTVRTVTEVTAQQDQTVFYPTGGYIPGYIDIEYNGSALGSQDFTALDGLSVTLAQKCGAGDLFRSKAYWPVALADTMRRAEINGIVGAGGWAMRNRLINGDFRIGQRGTSFSGFADGSYTLDRFFANFNGGGVFSVSQSSDAPAGFSNSALITVTTADASIASSDYYVLTQRIEGYNVADLAYGSASASPVTISFWVKSSVTGAYAVSLQGINASYRTYVSTVTVNSANTWEYKSFTVVGDTASAIRTTNSSGMALAFDFGCGSNYNASSGSWVTGEKYGTSGSVKLISTVGATFQITGVQLEKGSYATPFDFRPYATELVLCQRYFLPLFTPTANAYQNVCSIYSTTAAYFSITYPVEMRATPTITNNSMVVNVAVASNSSVASFGSSFPSTRACGVQITRTSGAAFTGGQAGHVDIVGGTAGGSLFASAEL